MRNAYGWLLCALLLAGPAIVKTFAETPAGRAEQALAGDFDGDRFLRNEWLPNYAFGWKWFRRSAKDSGGYARRTEDLLFEAVQDRLGLPYRFGGVDDRGYDCSGFVWRVFQEAGVDFDRSSTRDLWERLPEASPHEYDAFGTIVFFRNLNHVGIVRDGQSFYHASSSRGVTESNFDEYWGSRIVGYRRAWPTEHRREKKVRPRY